MWEPATSLSADGHSVHTPHIAKSYQRNYKINIIYLHPAVNCHETILPTSVLSLDFMFQNQDLITIEVFWQTICIAYISLRLFFVLFTDPYLCFKMKSNYRV